MQKTYTAIVKFLGSKTFFWLIIAFFILESLWIALSFRFPMIYDEGFHFNVIKIFSHQLSPVISDQPRSYDYLGDLGHQGSLVYHYLLSFPYRLIESLTPSHSVQIIFLRGINILMIGLGLIFFARIFRKMAIKQTYINTAILVFVLLPIVPFVAATINYDNMLFLLSALFFLVCADVIKRDKPSWRDMAFLIILGCFTSLVKFTFLPIFAVGGVYLIVLLLRRHGKELLPLVTRSLKNTSKVQASLVGFVLLISVGLFLAVYVGNTMRYGSPHPSCTKTLSKERCLASSLIKRNTLAKETKNQRPALSLPQYTRVTWLNFMTDYTNWSASPTTNGSVSIKPPLPVMAVLLPTGVLAGFAILFYSWRALRKSATWYFLITMATVLSLSIYLNNVRGYYSLHAAYGNQPRYFLSIVPIVLVMIVVGVAFALRRHPRLKLASFVMLMLLFTQGGGAITHIILSDDTWYWQNSTVIKANHGAKKVLRPLIKGV